MGDRTEHIRAEDFEALLDEMATGEGTSGDSEHAVRVRSHLADCEQCSLCYERMQSLEQILSQMKSAQHSPAGPDCPEEDAWLPLAAGEPGKAEELLGHAAHCDACGLRLRTALRDLAEPATPEEEAIIVGLQSGTPGWQNALLDRMCHAAPRRSAGAHWWTLGAGSTWKGVAIAGALGAIAVAGWMFYRERTGSEAAKRLIAQAYTRQRTLELRITGADYGPIRVERGGGDSSQLQRPRALLEAEALIANGLAEHPGSPEWLQAKGRADMLDGNYAAGFQSIKDALGQQPDSVELNIDMAVAYVQRAEYRDQPQDYGHAMEYLGRALAKAPANPVALFDRAIVSEKLFLYNQAKDDWEHYLRVEPSGAWAEEARRRLGAVREKLDQRSQQLQRRLLTPAELARASLDDAEAARVLLEERIDEYSHAAITEWLPAAFPPAALQSPPDPQWLKALLLLAITEQEKHGDGWFADVLKAAHGDGFPGAAAALADALKATDRGDFGEGYREASKAAELFTEAGNFAGKARADFESAYDLHLSQEGTPCLRASQSAIRDVGNTSFRWLQIQSRIEEGTCRWLGGDLGGAQRDYADALTQAESSGYRNLSLRALNHLSSANSAAGDLALSVAQARDGLQRYWSAYVPVIQGYNLYFSLHEVAELSREPYLDVVVWRESVALIDHRADIVLCAMAHSYYGDAAMAVGQPELARQEFERSSADFAAAPPSSATHMHLIEAETRIAGAESRLGKSDEAAARLERYEPEIGAVSDDFLALLFYRTRGDIQFHRGATEIAERDLLQAAAFAEVNLRSLKDESSRRRWSEENGNLYRELVELQLRQGQPDRALETWEWYRAASMRTSGGSTLGSSRTIEDPGIPSLHYVADQLNTLSDTTVLSYTVFYDGVAIWAYDDRGVKAAWVARPGAEINEMARQFQGLCADPNSSLERLRQQAGSLYQAIVAPVEHDLEPGRTILIDADSDLASVPFEALVDGRQEYFGESYALAWTPGLYYLGQLRAAARISSDTPLLVTAVESSHAKIAADLPRLPDAAREAHLVASQFRAATLKQNDRASLEEISAALPSAGVFHFAGHALASSGGPALVLWDSVLDAASLAPSSLAQLQLAVFSACETERGGQPGGENAESLVRIFSRAGVPYVVASRWRVDSTASAAFMQKFYAALLAGEDVTHALQAAERGLRSSPEMSHPYYWAPFHEFGRY